MLRSEVINDTFNVRLVVDHESALNNATDFNLSVK